jgi:phosphate/sulfate permease
MGKPAKKSNKQLRHRRNSWLRLARLATGAFLSVFVGRMADSKLITLVMIILSCLATGLISEETLVKIWPWNRKK